MEKTNRKHLTLSTVGKVTLCTFSDGRTLELNYDSLGESALHCAILYGIANKLTNAASISRDSATGKSAHIDDKYNAVARVIQRLESGGAWNTTATSGAARLIEVLIAFAADNGGTKSPATITAEVNAMSSAKINAYSTIAKLLPYFERFAPKSEETAEDLLGGFLE